MRSYRARSFSKLIVGASILALAAVPGVAMAQDTPAQDDGEIVVTGIRASLRASVEVKRNSAGVVDSINAEDMGKFPDTNLAESLQRIPGVSIDRANGEGSFVTVRGFGSDFNLVLLNGRQMPTSSLGDGGSAPAGRSFDFGNLASEGIAAVEVYKTGRAAIPSGGIGSTINIRTPRPLDRAGLHGSFAVKAVLDTSRNSGTEITPELSGIVSDTFANDAVGIMIAGSYQKRKASVNQANVGWRDGYLGNENNWGSLAMSPDPRAANITNRPDATDVYQVPQNASYDLNDIDRERINGQAVLQIRPVDNFTATIDLTYSRNTVEVRNSNVGIWFNHNDTSSSWTDGPVAGPIFYTERFGPGENKDLSYSGGLTENQSENFSVGGNIQWSPFERFTIELDGHRSTAVSRPINQYGSSMSVGNAVFGIQSQTVNFDNELPVISYVMHPGINALNTALITPTGNAFRTAYFKDRITQGQLNLRYDGDGLFDSLDFGVSYVDNRVRSAFGVIQNDTWGGAGPASDIPDDIFHLQTLPDKFPGLTGVGSNMIQSFYTFEFERMVQIIDSKYHTCGGDNNCIAPFTTDRRITEKTWSPYAQIGSTFDLFQRPAHFRAGVRFETTSIDSSALVPVPNATRWVGDNEFNIIQSGQSSFTTFTGKYENWLPSFDFDVEPIENVKLRVSYGHSITRPDYANMQGGRTVDQLFRVGGGTGLQGNPGLLPYKSKNFDASAEWYYARDSYVSAGFFHKDVSNFISTTRFDTNAFGLRTPVGGPRYNAAVAALGANASAGQIRQYIFCNYTNTTVITGGTACGGNAVGSINTLAADPLLNFQITTPVNSSQTATLYGWEFAIQHNFWNTGFGVILNYTIVRGDATYDNTKPSTVTQFALTGLSDSANAVLFYDKGGLQARVAYNWRDQFLAGAGLNPVYTEPYGQFDASASYEFTPGLTVFVEGINLTGESRRGHLRSERNVTFASPGYARYSGGVRFTF